MHAEQALALLYRLPISGTYFQDSQLDERGTLKSARQKPLFLFKQGLKNGEKNQLTPITERVHCTPMDGERWLAGKPIVDDTESDRPENFV